MSRRIWFGGACIIAAGFFMLGLVDAIERGDFLGAVLVAWVISPVIFTLVAACEGRHPYGVFHPRKQSLAFVFGDTIFLPLAYGMLALEVRHASYSFDLSATWIWSWFAVGVLVGILFHTADSVVYAKSGYAVEARSYGKILHDLFIYPALLGAMLIAGVGVLHQSSWSWPSAYFWVAVACCAVWLVLGSIDERQASRKIPWGHVAS